MTSRLAGTARHQVATLLALVAPFATRATAQQEPQALAVTHVSLVDARSAKPRQDQTVIVRGNRIVSVGDSRSTSVPAGARVIDGRGKYLVPGLWDMHVHTAITGGRDLLP
jgi:imidazolonepropionase-like amidohydrolase